MVRASALLLASVISGCGGGGEDRAGVQASGQPTAAAAQKPAAAATPAEDVSPPPAQRAQALSTADGSIPSAKAFLWAQRSFPKDFPDSPPTVRLKYQGRDYEVREYASGNYLGVSDNELFALGPYTGGRLTSLGPVASLESFCPRVGCTPSIYSRGEEYTALTVGPLEQEKLSRIVLPNGRGTDWTLSGKLHGEPAILGEARIYLKIEDPLKLFRITGPLWLKQTASGWTYDLRLQTTNPERPGRFAETFTVYACLDERCATRLAGTPVSVPYEITATPSVVLSRRTVTVTVPFGTFPPDQFVEAPRGPLVTAPPSLRFHEPVVPWDPFYAVAIIDTQGTARPEGQGERVRFRFQPRPIGYYQASLWMWTTVYLPGEQWSQLYHEPDALKLEYRVVASSVRYIAMPESLTVNARVGDNVRQSPVAFVFAGGESRLANMEVVRVDTLTAPSTASRTSGQLDRWLSGSIDTGRLVINVATCEIGRDPTPYCLPPGTYTARAVVRYDDYDASKVKTRRELAYPMRVNLAAK